VRLTWLSSAELFVFNISSKLRPLAAAIFIKVRVFGIISPFKNRHKIDGFIPLATAHLEYLIPLF